MGVAGGAFIREGGIHFQPFCVYVGEMEKTFADLEDFVTAPRFNWSDAAMPVATWLITNLATGIAIGVGVAVGLALAG